MTFMPMIMAATAALTVVRVRSADLVVLVVAEVAAVVAVPEAVAVAECHRDATIAAGQET
jgi:hypothetical protein